MKIFKISDVHYVVTNDSEIKNGDNKVCLYIPEKDVVINDPYCICELENLIEITHSTLHLFDCVLNINISDIEEIVKTDTTLFSWDVEFIEGKLKLKNYNYENRTNRI